MPLIEMPDGAVVDFPDDTPQEKILELIQKSKESLQAGQDTLDTSKIEEVDPEVLEAEEPKNEADTYEGFLTEVAEGTVSGVINIGSGIAQLIAEGVDLVADTS